MKRASMRARLNLSYLALSLMVVAVFSIVFYVYTSRILIARETERLDTFTKSLMAGIENAVRDMDAVSVDLVYINRTQNGLSSIISKASSGARDNASEQWLRYQALSELGSLFVAVNGSNIPVYRVNLFDLGGNCLSVGSVSVLRMELDVKAQPWYADVMAGGGYKVLTTPYLSTTLGSSVSRPQYYLSLVRLLIGKDRKAAGFVETVQNCAKVFGGVLALNQTEERVYILSAGGSLIYPFNGDTQMLDKALALKDNKDSRALASRISSGYTGWTYIVERSQRAVVQPARALLMTILLLSLAMSALIALYSLMASRRITRPLLDLAGRMSQTDAHSLDRKEAFPAPPGGYREIDRLNESFEEMRLKLNTSMNQLIATKQQALQSRNLAMQAQINPHFYYNTLSSIIALTDENRPDDVVAMCRALTGMMRYITASESKTTFREELRYISFYLHCMKIRYENAFEYRIDVPEALLDEVIPRLIIQPLVENALKYGMDCAPPWKLFIGGEDTQDCWRVWVQDNGPGFPKEALNKIKDGMRELDVTQGMPESHIGGMGVLNVYARWKLHAGADALFEAGGDTGGGYVMIGKERRREA
jgi:two-component system, sensor histidine kinase YesM